MVNGRNFQKLTFKFLIILAALVIFAPANVGAADMDSITVTVKFIVPTRAQISSESLGRLFSNERRNETGESTTEDSDGSYDNTYSVKTNSHSGRSLNKERVSGGGGGENKLSGENKHKKGKSENSIDFYYDSSI